MSKKKLQEGFGIGELPSSKLIKMKMKLTDIMREQEDIEVGHTDDEPGMLKQYAHDMAEYSKQLYDMLDKFDQMPQEVDFPTWWQAKLIKARDYISKAAHYLEFEMKDDQNL